MFRITRFRLAVVLLVVVGAFFIDGYSLIYRYLVAHQPLGQTLTSTPSFLGRDLFIHKGLDLQGGTELTIEICHGLQQPQQRLPQRASERSHPAVRQQSTIPILDLRVNSLGVSEASVQAQGNDQILVQLPGVSLKQAIDTIGTTSRLYFATTVAGPPDPTSASFLADQQGHYDTAQFGNPLCTRPAPTGRSTTTSRRPTSTRRPSARMRPTARSRSTSTSTRPGATGGRRSPTPACRVPDQPVEPPPGADRDLPRQRDSDTAPQVTGGGQSNQTQITGNFTSDSATKLANLISAGALPASITTVASNTVSANLSASSRSR